MEEKEKILITGGAGYLGNVMARNFLNNGYKVTCLDNLMYRQDYSIFPLASNRNFDFIFGDVRDGDLLKRIVQKYDIIIPLAAIVGSPACDARPFDAVTVNRDAVSSINKIRSNNQMLIFPNTNSGYGTKSGQYHCDEKTPLEPISVYGISKVEAERSITESGKDAVVFRLASVFGISPRMRLDLSFHKMVMDALTNKSIVLSEGNYTRNYIYIGDIARAFQHAIENYDNMKGEVYNLGSDEANISKMDLAKKVASHIPNTLIYENNQEKDQDKRNYLVSNEKLKNAGFKAETSLDHGIEDLIKGVSIMLRNNPNRNL